MGALPWQTYSTDVDFSTSVVLPGSRTPKLSAEVRELNLQLLLDTTVAPTTRVFEAASAFGMKIIKRKISRHDRMNACMPPPQNLELPDLFCSNLNMPIILLFCQPFLRDAREEYPPLHPCVSFSP
jgi:hypothetical protein